MTLSSLLCVCWMQQRQFEVKVARPGHKVSIVRPAKIPSCCFKIQPDAFKVNVSQLAKISVVKPQHEHLSPKLARFCSAKPGIDACRAEESQLGHMEFIMQSILIGGGSHTCRLVEADLDARLHVSFSM